LFSARPLEAVRDEPADFDLAEKMWIDLLNWSVWTDSFVLWVILFSSNKTGFSDVIGHVKAVCTSSEVEECLAAVDEVDDAIALAENVRAALEDCGTVTASLRASTKETPCSALIRWTRFSSSHLGHFLEVADCLPPQLGHFSALSQSACWWPA
jgi:hypothetical protein